MGLDSCSRDQMLGGLRSLPHPQPCLYSEDGDELAGFPLPTPFNLFDPALTTYLCQHSPTSPTPTGPPSRPPAAPSPPPSTTSRSTASAAPTTSRSGPARSVPTPSSPSLPSPAASAPGVWPPAPPPTAPVHTHTRTNTRNPRFSPGNRNAEKKHRRERARGVRSGAAPTLKGF